MFNLEDWCRKNNIPYMVYYNEFEYRNYIGYEDVNYINVEILKFNSKNDKLINEILFLNPKIKDNGFVIIENS